MLSRLLNLLLIREGERQQVIYFFALYVILGCGLAFGRNSADVLFFKRYGIEYLPVMYMVLSVFLTLLSAFYAAFADRIPPERLSSILFIFLMFLLLGNWVWISYSEVGAAYPAYYLLSEIASEILIVHSIHYLAQNFDSLQAKRLFPLIMAGTQIGIIIGGLTLAAIAQYINIQDIMLVWCFMLLIPVYMIYFWHKQHGSSTYFRPMHKSTKRFKQAISQVSSGFSLIKTSQLLKAASFALFFMVIAFYILNYSINRIYTTTFETEAELTRFFGILTATTNGLALLLQIFITNRVIHRFGVKNINLIFPITSLFSLLALLSSFTLIPAIIGSINRNAIMTAFRNPIRTIFFNALPANIRGRANATSIVIVLPLALFICGALLMVIQEMGEPAYYLAIGFIAAALYLIFNLKMNKAYVSEMLSTIKKKILVTDDMESTSSNYEISITSERKMSNEVFKSNTILKIFKMLMLAYPEKANELLLLNADQSETILAEKIIKSLASEQPQGFSSILNKLLSETKDIRLKSTILITLFKLQDQKVVSLIPSLLDDINPRMQISAIIGALQQNNKLLKDKAVNQWIRLTSSSNIDEQILTLDLIEYLAMVTDSKSTLLPIYKSMIASILGTDNKIKITMVLNALLNWPESHYPEIASLLTKVYERSDTLTRLLCVRCSRLFYDSDQALLKKAIEDSNRKIRQQAARIHYEMMGDDTIDILVLWLATEANGSPRAQRAFLSLLHEVIVDSHSFRKIARAKAEVAQKFFWSLQILNRYKGEQSVPLDLVKLILQERIKQYINLSVYAMKGFENAEVTYIVWAGLNSRDPRYIASACEVLRNIRSKDIGEMLSDLIEQRPKKISKQVNSKFCENTESVLLWCMKLPDPWLSTCAKKALQSLA